MQEVICSVRKKIEYLCGRNKYYAQWVKDDGDSTLRLDYDLNECSVVFDVGGYKGQWASDIFSKYQSKIFIFEPVPEYAEKIKKRFSKNKKIEVLDFGLGGTERKTIISVQKDGSSIYKNSIGCESEQVNIMSGSEFIFSRSFEKIDLMKINIEGGEYELLNDLIKTGVIKKIENLQVQFHNIFPDAECKMLSIQEALSRTHRLTYQYPFVWENWKLKTAHEKESV
jgi:FkbM family methyltransferase